MADPTVVAETQDSLERPPRPAQSAAAARVGGGVAALVLDHVARHHDALADACRAAGNPGRADAHSNAAAEMRAALTGGYGWMLDLRDALAKAEARQPGAPTWRDLLAAEFGHPYMTEVEQAEFAALVAHIEAALARTLATPAPAVADALARAERGEAMLRRYNVGPKVRDALNDSIGDVRALAGQLARAEGERDEARDEAMEASEREGAANWRAIHAERDRDAARARPESAEKVRGEVEAEADALQGQLDERDDLLRRVCELLTPEGDRGTLHLDCLLPAVEEVVRERDDVRARLAAAERALGQIAALAPEQEPERGEWTGNPDDDYDSGHVRGSWCAAIIARATLAALPARPSTPAAEGEPNG